MMLQRGISHHSPVCPKVNYGKYNIIFKVTKDIGNFLHRNKCLQQMTVNSDAIYSAWHVFMITVLFLLKPDRRHLHLSICFHFMLLFLFKVDKISIISWSDHYWLTCLSEKRSKQNVLKETRSKRHYLLVENLSLMFPS